MASNKRDNDELSSILMKFDEAYMATIENRQQCIEDRRINAVSGASWEGPLALQFENRPKFEVNKTNKHVVRILNAWQKNEVTPIFSPKSDDADQALADTCAGMFRAMYNSESAIEAMACAVRECASGGMGAVRLRADYIDDEDDDDDRQEIFIEPIFEADQCVFYDPSAKRYDKSDASFVFVLHRMSREKLNELYPNVSTFPAPLSYTSTYDWGVSANQCSIAEFYNIEETFVRIESYKFPTGDIEKFNKEDLTEEKLIEIESLGGVFESSRKIKQRRVRKRLVAGNVVLEDFGYIAGKHIPVAPMYGYLEFVDGLERCWGVVRNAKDPLRLGNMLRSRLAEISALSSIEKPIFVDEQVLGHELEWAADNINNQPFLRINQLNDKDGNPVAAGPVGFTKAPNIPPALAALIQVCDADSQDVLGAVEEAEKIRANVSGEAIANVQESLDMQTYIFVSNAAKTVRRIAEIWMSMAQDVYVEEGRKVKIVSQSGEASNVELLRPIIDEKTGELKYENDLSRAKFDVSISLGAHSSTKRNSVTQKLINMLPLITDQETAMVLSLTILRNIEGDGLIDIRRYVTNKLLRLGAIEPTKEQAEEMMQEAQSQKPGAAEEFYLAEAEKAKALTQKALADTQYSYSRANETQAKTAQIVESLRNK